jgi:hypothetical protein
MELRQCSSKGLAYYVEYITHGLYYDDTIIVFARKDSEIAIVTWQFHSYIIAVRYIAGGEKDKHNDMIDEISNIRYMETFNMRSISCLDLTSLLYNV